MGGADPVPPLDPSKKILTTFYAQLSCLSGPEDGIGKLTRNDIWMSIID